MLLVEGETFLTRLEEESLAQFEKKLLHLAYDGILELTLTINGIRFETKKLQCNGILDDIGGFLHYLSLARQAHNLLLVAAQG